MDLKRNDPAKLGILFILALSILIVTLFCNWIGVSILWEDEYVTLAKTANILEDLGGVTEERSLEAAKLVIYLFLLICAITSAITIYSLFKALASETEPSEAGFIVPSILAILVILAVLVANAVLSRETGGWVDGAFSLAFSPFYVLGAGVLGTYLCRTLNKPAPDYSDVVVRHFCPVCKKEVKEGAFCPTCGGKLVDAAALCDQCGELAPVGALFCPKCGKDLRDLSEKLPPLDDFHCQTCGAVLSKEKIKDYGLEYCPQCGEKITPYTASGRIFKGVCPSCFNYRSLGHFCPVCGRVVPKEVFVTADETN